MREAGVELMICGYCGSSKIKNERCVSCGGPCAALEQDKPLIEKGEPFFYNGFVVWAIRDHSRREISFYFYAGMELVDIISFTWDFWHTMGDNHPGTDTMPFVWQMFEINQEKRGPMLVMENKSIRPAAFLICRKEHPETERAKNMTWEQAIENYSEFVR